MRGRNDHCAASRGASHDLQLTCRLTSLRSALLWVACALLFHATLSLAGVSSARKVPLEVAPLRVRNSKHSTRGFFETVKIFERLLPPSTEYVLRTHNATLSGGITSIGEYFTRIQIGGQDLRVQADTGSSTLAVPLAQCTTCRREDLRYNLGRSQSGVASEVDCKSRECGTNTCRYGCSQCSHGRCCAEDDPSKCGFFLRYGDGSGAQGALMYDELSWAGHTFRAYFGGVLRDSSGFERTGVDGILGLAYAPLACNPTCIDPVFDVLVKEKLSADIFSICMFERGGSITLGGYDKAALSGDVQWVPMLRSYPMTFYAVPLPGYIGIGNRSVDVPHFRTAIVDSGTTLIVMSTKTFAAVVTHLKEHYCHIPGICGRTTWFQPAACVKIGGPELDLLPSIRFAVSKDVELELRPEDYMLEYKAGKEVYRCVGIMTLDGVDIDVILGNTLNMRYVTIYDRRKNRIGFAQRRKECGGVTSTCSTLGTCQECASASNCKYNYVQKLCLDDKGERDTFFGLPYPECTGRLCFCETGAGSWVSTLLTGVAIGLVVAGAMLLLARLSWSVSSRAGYREIRDD